MGKITGSAITQESISVYGLKGTFSKLAGTEDSVSVKYFSTKVTISDDSDVGNGKSLLERLKPMREVVSASELRDLSSILQRDLNDTRVSKELVPYLLGRMSPIAFFPPVVVALIPKGFFDAEQAPEYPKPSDEEEHTVDYDGFWAHETYPLDGAPTALGRLQIFTKHTDLIVLDGQHRANAFRYVSGDFPGSADNDIYAVFYDAIANMADGAIHPERVELPVTIVWFESQQEINPLTISRRLFVDVNNNAKTVNESRKILLDDTSPINAATTAVYEILGERGFEPSRLSLLHAGYDADNDPISQKERLSPLALFSPSMLRDALSFFLLGTSNAFSVGMKYSNYAVGMMQNFNHLYELVPALDESSIVALQQGSAEAARSFKKSMKNGVLGALVMVIDDFPLYDIHVNATADTESWINENLTAPDPLVWQKVFKGGEGLYYSFLDLRNAAQPEGGVKSLSTPQRNYLKAIQRIEAKFAERLHDRSPVAKNVSIAVFRTVRTKAFLTGYLMAFANYAYKVGPVNHDTASQFVEHISSIGVDRWITALVDFRQAVVPSLDPKVWWIVRNIVLRLLEGTSSELEFFPESDADAMLSIPERLFIDQWIGSRLDDYEYQYGKEAQAGQAPEESTVAGWQAGCRKALSNVLQRMKLESKVPLTEQANAKSPNLDVIVAEAVRRRFLTS